MLTTPPPHTWSYLVDEAIREDLGPGDVTSDLLIPGELRSEARIEARESLVVSGLDVAECVLARFDVAWEPCLEDATHVEPGALLGVASGAARGILAAERVALNFLQHLSGIATLTRSYCAAVSGTGATIVDTRKTTPGWRVLEKYAVRCGNGANHRMGLYDGILIKDNHIAALGSVAAAVKQARAANTNGLRIQVEIESVAQALEALEAGADALLIDNQPLAALREIVARVRSHGRPLSLEASGGISLESVHEIALCGVDRISVGALTHSARAVDIALEWNAASSS